MKYFNYITEYDNLAPHLLEKFISTSGVITDNSTWKMAPKLYEASLLFIHVIYADSSVSRARLAFAEFNENMEMIRRVTNISSRTPELVYQYAPTDDSVKYVYFFTRPTEDINNSHIDFFTIT